MSSKKTRNIKVISQSGHNYKPTPTIMTNVLNAVKSGFTNVKNHITGLASQAFN